jgi:alkylhydroperoxidase family enzyme
MKALARKEVAGRERAEGLSERQWAVVRYTDAMTKEVRVSEDVFGELRRLFSEREVVEITATVCFSCALPKI